MEGLRISVVVLGSFIAGMSTRVFFGQSQESVSEHLAAATTCPSCADCSAPTAFHFSR